MYVLRIFHLPGIKIFLKHFICRYTSDFTRRAKSQKNLPIGSNFQCEVVVTCMK